MSAREIWECSNCDGLFWNDENCTCDSPNWNGPASQERLRESGFSIIRDSENHGPTWQRAMERAAEIAETARGTKFGPEPYQHTIASPQQIATALRALAGKAGEA